MGRPNNRQALIRNARNGGPVQRVEVPKTHCLRCAGRRGIYALGRWHSSASPSGHAAGRADAQLGHRCRPSDRLRGIDMDIHELHDALPEELRVKSRELVPPEIALRAFAFMGDRNALLRRGGCL